MPTPTEPEPKASFQISGPGPMPSVSLFMWSDGSFVVQDNKRHQILCDTRPPPKNTRAEVALDV